MTDKKTDVEVTQADRDIAAPFASCLSDMQDIFDGKADLLPIVQAFARHRQQAAIAQHEGDEKPVVVTIGAGEIVSNWGTYHDLPAVFLQPTPDGPGEFGAKLDRDYPKDSVPPGTVVLQFKGPATVLLEDIASAIGAASTPATPAQMGDDESD